MPINIKKSKLNTSFTVFTCKPNTLEEESEVETETNILVGSIEEPPDIETDEDKKVNVTMGY